MVRIPHCTEHCRLLGTGCLCVSWVSLKRNPKPYVGCEIKQAYVFLFKAFAVSAAVQMKGRSNLNTIKVFQSRRVGVVFGSCLLLCLLFVASRGASLSFSVQHTGELLCSRHQTPSCLSNMRHCWSIKNVLFNYHLFVLYKESWIWEPLFFSVAT